MPNCCTKGIELVCIPASRVRGASLAASRSIQLLMLQVRKPKHTDVKGASQGCTVPGQQFPGPGYELASPPPTPTLITLSFFELCLSQPVRRGEESIDRTLLLLNHTHCSACMCTVGSVCVLRIWVLSLQGLCTLHFITAPQPPNCQPCVLLSVNIND